MQKNIIVLNVPSIGKSPILISKSETEWRSIYNKEGKGLRNEVKKRWMVSGGKR